MYPAVVLSALVVVGALFAGRMRAHRTHVQPPGAGFRAVLPLALASVMSIATIERLGYESGLWETTIRTDSQPITKQPIEFKTGTGIATGEQFLARNLAYYDAIFFFGVREADLTAQQKADLLSFVRDDGKGFVATHAGSTSGG